MAKLVDAPDLGSGAVMCKGSSPFSPILLKAVSAVFFAPVGISPFARYCIRSRSHGSIILRRLSIVAGRFHQSALHSGLRFLLVHSLKDRILRYFCIARQGRKFNKSPNKKRHTKLLQESIFSIIIHLL